MCVFRRCKQISKDGRWKAWASTICLRGSLGKFLFLYVAFAIAGGLAVAVYFVAGRQLGCAITAAWLMLATFAVGVIILMALTFQRFDVARDWSA